MIQQEQAGTVSQRCRAVGMARASYYRYRGHTPPVDTDTELRDKIQRLALKSSCYGYRRITAALHRQGVRVNHKRVLRLMRADNLLCLRKKRFVQTTDSQHGFAVYPNLPPDLTVTACDQLWVADLTYIHLHSQFIYLAVILDVFSRRCIGWELGPHLDAPLALAALQQALTTRRVTPTLVHHSDRGVQYASQDYTDLLKQHGVRISMSRRGNPYDNAFAESFMKTLKYEEVYLNEYDSLTDAKASIYTFLDTVYNAQRLHSALGYRPPAEFEQSLTLTAPP